MNVERMNQLIEHLRNLDNSAESKLGFDMEKWYGTRDETDHECGTACCICGHAQYLAMLELLPYSCFSDWLDIPNTDAAAITVPDEDIGAYDASPAQAVKLLEHYRDTGVVDWQQAMSE